LSYAAPSGRGNSSRSQAPISHAAAVLRRGQCIGSREIGMLAACGFAELPVVRRPRVAVLSTGDELVPPSSPLRPAAVYDSNDAIIAAGGPRSGWRGGGLWPPFRTTTSNLRSRWPRARRMRHGGHFRRNLEGGRLSVLSNFVTARVAGSSSSRRRPQAGQAIVPRGDRRRRCTRHLRIRAA